MSKVPCRKVKTKQHFDNCRECMTLNILPIHKSLLEIYLISARLISTSSFLKVTRKHEILFYYANKFRH